MSDPRLEKDRLAGIVCFSCTRQLVNDGEPVESEPQARRCGSCHLDHLELMGLLEESIWIATAAGGGDIDWSKVTVLWRAIA